MRHLKKHIERVSLEDAENSEADLTPKDPVVENVASEPEEVEQLYADLLVDPEPAGDSVRAEIEEVGDIQESLEHFQVILKDAIGRGGMRAEEGVLYQTSMAHFNKRLGIQGKESLGMEDFGGKMSRLKATQISQEGFGETAKAAGTKIKELIIKLLAFLKEKIAAFDVQGQKVKAIISQIKERVKTIVTGEIEFEFQTNKRIGERDILNPKTLGSAAQWATTLNQHMTAHLKATGDVIKKLIREGGDESDTRAFNESITGMWGGGTNPVKAVMAAHESVGIPLTQGYRAILTHTGGAGDTGILSHSLLLKGDAPQPIKMTLTKGQLITLLDNTEKMNDAVLAMIKAYSANAGVVGGLNGPLGIKDPQAEASVDKVISNLVTLVERDIYPILEHISAARGELGYVCAMAAKKFGL